MTAEPRLEALDGLRGWAALSVVVFHFAHELFRVLFPAYGSTLILIFGDGGLAVSIFLTLSGYVLTLRRWHRTNNPSLVVVLVRRYFRLGISIFAATAIVWLLMTLGLTSAPAANAIVHRDDWLGQFATFRPNLWTAFTFAVWRVYFLVTYDSYGPFLWTMMVELWGSAAVLILSHSPRVLREPYSILLVQIVLFLVLFPLAACLPAGALFAVLQRDIPALQRAPGPIESFLASWTIVALLLAAAGAQLLVPLAVCGTLMLIAVTRSLPAQWFLTRPVSHWLGRVSFPIYLMQYPVLIAPVCFMVIGLNNAGLLNPWTALGVVVAGVALVLVAARLFLPVETFTLRFIKKIDLYWVRAVAGKLRDAAGRRRGA